jgi:hypothetical protein
MTIYYPKPNAKDSRVAFDGVRIENEGVVWYVSGKWDGKIIKVNRLIGDVTKPKLLEDALINFAAGLDLAMIQRMPA